MTNQSIFNEIKVLLIIKKYFKIINNSHNNRYKVIIIVIIIIYFNYKQNYLSIYLFIVKNIVLYSNNKIIFIYLQKRF